MRLITCASILLALFMLHSIAHACRFNVRDVGMVDFASVPYKLYGIVDDTVSESDVAAIRQISYASTMDSNIETGIVHITKDADHRAIKHYKELGEPAIPALVFVSPKDKAMHIEWRNTESSFKESVWSTMDYLVDSPFRSTILDECIRSYGVTLLIEGTNQDKNDFAEEKCRQAIAKITDGMQDLPKEVKYPPVFARLKREHFDDEHLLLWSYGVNPEEQTEPMVAIVYGRGRQIGKILNGDEVTAENILTVLSVIGLSCECGLDRSWMMGQMYPLVWNDERRKMAMSNVGFDTESPMVKTEISQIMSKGSLTQKGGNGTDRYASPDPLLGYAEISLADAQIYEDAYQMRESSLQESIGNSDEESEVFGIELGGYKSADPEFEVKEDITDIEFYDTQSADPELEVRGNEEDTIAKLTKASENKEDYRREFAVQTSADSEIHAKVDDEETVKKIVSANTLSSQTDTHASSSVSAPVYPEIHESGNVMTTLLIMFGALAGVALICGSAVVFLAWNKHQ